MQPPVLRAQWQRPSNLLSNAGRNTRMQTKIQRAPDSNFSSSLKFASITRPTRQSQVYQQHANVQFIWTTNQSGHNKPKLSYTLSMCKNIVRVYFKTSITSLQPKESQILLVPTCSASCPRRPTEHRAVGSEFLPNAACFRCFPLHYLSSVIVVVCLFLLRPVIVRLS